MTSQCSGCLSLENSCIRRIACPGRVPDGFHVKSNIIRAIVVRRRHRVRYYVIRDVFDIYKYFDAIDLRYYVIREAIVI